MKIILNQDVETLGEEGDVKIVADGYARNFLIPKGFAVLFNKDSVHAFEQKKAKIEARKKAKLQAALGLKDQLNQQVLEFTVSAGENGKLFGAITSANIAEMLLEKGLEVEKRHISVPDHSLKMVGEYEVRIRVLEKESAVVKVIVKAE